MFKRREAIIFIILAIAITTLALLQRDKTFFIYGLLELLLYFVFACTLIYGIYRLITDRRPLSFIDKSKPLMFGLLITGFFIVLSCWMETDAGKKTVLTAGFNHDLNFVHLKLFDDNKFRLLNSGPFGGRFYRGTYILRNDTLKINNDGLRNLYPSLTFILKQQDDQSKSFHPVDTSKSMYQLYIYEDFRKNP